MDGNCATLIDFAIVMGATVIMWELVIKKIMVPEIKKRWDNFNKKRKR